MPNKMDPEKRGLTVRMHKSDKALISSEAKRLGCTATDLLLYCVHTCIKSGINERDLLQFLADRNYQGTLKQEAQKLMADLGRQGHSEFSSHAKLSEKIAAAGPDHVERQRSEAMRRIMQRQGVKGEIGPGRLQQGFQFLKDINQEYLLDLEIDQMNSELREAFQRKFSESGSDGDAAENGD